MEFTAKVIDLAKLTPEQVKVVCSVSGDNGENNQRKLGKDYPIGQPSDPVKKINFYTSTCFEGCDIYDENGVTFIVSDGNKSNTLLDISTLFTQICGRLRDSKYKGEIIHVYSTTKYSRDVTLDEFVASTKKVFAEAVDYAKEINGLSETAREKTLSKIKYINEQYVNINKQLEIDPKAEGEAPETWTAHMKKLWNAYPEYLVWKADHYATKYQENMFANIMTRVNKDGAWAQILKIYDDEKRVSYDEFYGISTPAMSSKGALMAQEVSEYYLKAIMGEKNIDDTWDSFVSSWKKIGGDEVAAEVNAWYAEQAK